MNQLSLETASRMLAFHCATVDAGVGHSRNLTRTPRYDYALTLALALCALAGLVFVVL